MMTADDAIRFLAHEAQRCRDRDAHEAFCLLLPALCKVLGVRPLDDVAALEFERDFHNELRALNESPLAECHCEVCGFAETLPECRFSKDPEFINVPGWQPIAKSWCSGCGAERFFVRRETVPA